MPTPSPSYPFSLEAYPVKATAPAGPAHYTVTVVNKGTKELHVDAQTVNLHGQCSKLQFQPAAFNLMPGHHQHVTVTAPAGAADYLSQFNGAVVGHGIGVGAGIGSRLVVGHPGTAGVHCTAAKTHPANSDHIGGTPWWMFAAVAAAVLLAVVVVVRAWRKHRAA